MAAEVFERLNGLFVRGAEVPIIRLPCGLQGIPRPWGPSITQQAKLEPKPPRGPPPAYLLRDVTPAPRSKVMPDKHNRRPRSPSYSPVRFRSNSRSRHGGVLAVGYWRRWYNTERGSKDRRTTHRRSQSWTRSWSRSRDRRSKKHKEHKKLDEDSDSDAWGGWTAAELGNMLDVM